MSSFAGIPFRIEAESGSWFPTPELDDDGKYTYQCRAFIDTLARRNALAGYVSIVTWRRPLGTISIIGHIEAGKGSATLVILKAGGQATNHTAVLTAMRSVDAYAKHAGKGFMADLEFVLLSNPLV